MYYASEFITSVYQMRKMIVTVTGPSGSGKTELVHELCANHNFEKLVSVTTRHIRPGEVEGKDYYFISHDDFSNLQHDKQLVQSAHFNGFYYGTTLDELKRVYEKGNVPIVIVEPGGIPQFREIANKEGYALCTVFVGAERRTLIERYLRRIDTYHDSVQIPYHARRISAITEEMNWKTAWSYDLQLFNDADDLTQIAKLAEQVGDLCGKG